MIPLLVQDMDCSVSPGSRGELRLIPLLNQEGVGGGLLSHCEPFALLPPWFRIGLTSPL